MKVDFESKLLSQETKFEADIKEKKYSAYSEDVK